MIQPEKGQTRSLAAQLMAIEVISQLLVSSSPLKLGEALTEHLRELSGAKTVMVLAHRPLPDTDILLHVSPIRRTTVFSPAELDLFCPDKNPGHLPWVTVDFPENNPLKPLLLQKNIQSVVRYPLNSGGEVIGQLLMFDMPEIDRFAETDQIINLLLAPIGLALKNALNLHMIEQQALELEKRVEDRTAELKQMNFNLQMSEERHRTILETAMDGFWLLDTKGHLLEVNETYCRMSGYSEQELLKMHIVDLEAVESIEEIYQRIRKDMENGWDRFETKHRRKDGTIFDVEVSVQFRRQENGQLVVFLRDITANKLAEENKIKLEEQLLQSQKMESVGRLAGGVAHDFNNMLGVIIGHAELALLSTNTDDPNYGHLKEISTAAERSADLTRQLLAFARKQTVAPKVLDLNETITGMLKMLQRLIGEGLQLIWRPAAGIWSVKMDPSQIDQILANLCVNARDAITDIGRVLIETTNCSIDADYCLSHIDAIPGEYVKLSVSDSGCGMDSDTITKIFEPFFTTKEVGKGTGLGLATVFGIVKQNNGFINVYSEPGEGTTFTIYLPRFGGRSENMLAEADFKQSNLGKETVLLVEDEPALLRMVFNMLEKSGYNVLMALTPGEAIALAQEHKGEIDLLITDVIMPVMNGSDLAKRLLPIFPKMKRLFMSGYTAEIIAHHGVLEEGVNFIQKPFTITSLSNKLREILD